MNGGDAMASQLGVLGVRWGAIPPRWLCYVVPMVSHGMWTLGAERWRYCEAHRALRDSADAVIRCEVEWQRWLERQEERCRDDTTKADFFDSRWWEPYWRRIEISKLIKDPKGE